MFQVQEMLQLLQLSQTHQEYQQPYQAIHLQASHQLTAQA